MKATQGSKNRQPIVRVNQQAKEKLDRMQEQTDMSQPALLDRAITLLDRELRAEQLQSDFEALASDPVALAQYQTTAKIFDKAARDGIKDL